MNLKECIPEQFIVLERRLRFNQICIALGILPSILEMCKVDIGEYGSSLDKIRRITVHSFQNRDSFLNVPGLGGYLAISYQNIDFLLSTREFADSSSHYLISFLSFLVRRI